MAWLRRNRDRELPRVYHGPPEPIPPAGLVHALVNDMRAYDLPLNRHCTVTLRLPRLLAQADADRICRYVQALAIDAPDHE